MIRKKVKMKKLIFSLAILFSIDVYALPMYTDYEFAGYTEHEQEEDELTKYDLVYLNKFYKLTEVDEEYLETSDSHEFKDESDVQIETVYSKQRSEKYLNIPHIKIENQDNYLTRKIMISNIEPIENLKIKEIEVYNLEQKMPISIPSYEKLTDGDLIEGVLIDDNEFIISLGTIVYVDNIKVIIYYETNEEFTLTYTPMNSSGLMRISQQLVLSKEDNLIEISTLKSDKYAEFLEEKSFDYEPITYYYSYDTKKFRYYNLEKAYYIFSELDYIEGYTYDPLESVAVYRIYKREYLGEDETVLPLEDTEENAKEKEYIKYTVYADRKDTEIVAEENSSTQAVSEVKCENKIDTPSVVENLACTCDEKEDKYEKWLYICLIIITSNFLLNIVHILNVKSHKSK